MRLASTASVRACVCVASSRAARGSPLLHFTFEFGALGGRRVAPVRVALGLGARAWPSLACAAAAGVTAGVRVVVPWEAGQGL